ncbi:XkdX family protein [Bacillus sp. 4A_MP3]
MMDWFTSVKTIYGWGRSITVMQTLARFVEWGRITEDEYKQITGLTYPMTKQPVSVDLGGAAN